MSHPRILWLATVLLVTGPVLGQTPAPAPAPTAPAEPLTAPPMAVHGMAGAPDCAGPDCGGPAAGPGSCGVLTAEGEYLLWFLANSRDSIGLASTDVLGAGTLLGTLGDAEHDHRGPTSGGRVTVGYWLIEGNPWVAEGIRDAGGEARFFLVGKRGADFHLDTPATLVIPFFDVNNRRESGLLVAAPGVATGGITARSQVEIWGGEANVWKNVYYNWPGTNFAVDLMAGFRYMSYDGDFDLNATSLYSPNIPANSSFASLAGDRLVVQDSFSVHNRFYGGQVGISAKSWVTERMRIEGDFRLAVGTTDEELSIAGAQVRTSPTGATSTAVGGLFALPSNIGDHHMNKFSQIPEADLKLAYPLGEHLIVTGGFSALYWTRLLRAAHQVSREIDITQIPNFPLAAGATPTGLGLPNVPFRQSDLWLLGISVGAEVSW